MNEPLALRRVLRYIDRHLDEPLDLETLSEVAELSPHHFQRSFAAALGLTAARYVRLLRLRRAAYRLAFRPGARILDLALDAGYSSHEAFTRAFARVCGRTPAAFRAAPTWEAWHTAARLLRPLRARHMPSEPQATDVRIVDFPRTPVALLTHRGDPAGIEATIARFVAFRRAHGLPPSASATFNVCYGSPDDADPAEFRIDLCAATTQPVPENPQGVVASELPAARCAVLRHVGSDATLGQSFAYLYGSWIPARGEAPHPGAQPFLQRIAWFPDVPEHEAIVDVFAPLAS
ncbi:MAG: AraC family transcriptional regulator [Planctomycetota bacterium]